MPPDSIGFECLLRADTLAKKVACVALAFLVHYLVHKAVGSMYNVLVLTLPKGPFQGLLDSCGAGLTSLPKGFTLHPLNHSIVSPPEGLNSSLALAGLTSFPKGFTLDPLKPVHYIAPRGIK